MNDTTYGMDSLIKAARAAAEAFLASLNEDGHGSGSGGQQDAAGLASVDEPIEYDPLHDNPPFPANPKEGAPDAHKRMAYVAYLGAVGRLNAEEGRGASGKEIAEFAKRAGYSGGAAVNGWNSRTGSPRAIELDENGGRFMNGAALGWIQKDAAKLGLKLVASSL
jgi:hypothetical protein